MTCINALPRFMIHSRLRDYDLFILTIRADRNQVFVFLVFFKIFILTQFQFNMRWIADNTKSAIPPPTCRSSKASQCVIEYRKPEKGWFSIRRAKIGLTIFRAVFLSIEIFSYLLASS